jgi:hypothetical protein
VHNRSKVRIPGLVDQDKQNIGMDIAPLLGKEAPAQRGWGPIARRGPGAVRPPHNTTVPDLRVGGGELAAI